jgi:drug/metabolite transporter (DMT)-like permease
VLNPIWVALFTGETPGRFAMAGGAVIFITVLTYNIWAEKASRKG